MPTRTASLRCRRMARGSLYLSRQGSVFTAPRARVMIRDLHSRADARACAFLRPLAHGSRLVGGLEDRSTQPPKMYCRRASLPSMRRAAPPSRSPAMATSPGSMRRATCSSSRRDALDSPAQVYEIAAPQRAHELTHVGADALAQTPFSPFELFAFKGWNEESVHGFVVKPSGFQPERKYPVAFLIHGGPHGTFGNAWSYRWNPQVWSGMGYAVVIGRFPRLERLRRGICQVHRRPLGRPAARGSAEGLGLRARALRLFECRAGLRARRLLRRLHGCLDRGELEQTLEVPRQSRRRI